jgi:hypothetical protein
MLGDYAASCSRPFDDGQAHAPVPMIFQKPEMRPGERSRTLTTQGHARDPCTRTGRCHVLGDRS